MAASSLHFLVLTLLVPSYVVALTCLNNQGKKVDWFIVYKLPQNERSKIPLVREGFGHFYMDSDNSLWSLSNVSLNDSGHAIFNTLQQIYKNYNSKSVAYFMYDDEPPDTEEFFTYGHTKGDMAYDKLGGFWLVHSVPRFPNPANSSYKWPNSARMYGQSALCISVKRQDVNMIAEQMQFNKPYIYNKNLPVTFKETDPAILALLNGKHARGNRTASFYSALSGKMFTSFAKSSSFNADLYDAWVAPYLQSDLYTETWQRGGSPSYCPTGTNFMSKFKVENVLKINFPSGVSFKETDDHSKWAMTNDDKKKIICIGDINRMESQHHRGGGTVCFEDDIVWKEFSSIVQKVEECRD